MIDFFTNSTKSIVEKKNPFVILQILWIFEFYVLDVSSVKELLRFITKEEIQELQIVEDYRQTIINWIDKYNEYIFMMGIILLVVGVSGSVFIYIPFLSRYRIIYMYSDFGLYAGFWIFLMCFTYKIFVCMGKVFFISPIIVYVTFLFVKKIKEWLETNGVTFGDL